MEEIKKGDKVFHARILPSVGIYDVCELHVRSVCDNWFVGIDKRDKQAHMLDTKEIGKTVFKDRSKAVAIVYDAEKDKKNVSGETYYEEY